MIQNKKTFEERLFLVEEIIERKKSNYRVAKENGVSKMILRDWVRRYKAVGPDGLIPFKTRMHYSKEVKKQAVEAVLIHEERISDVVKKFNISAHTVLRGWIKGYTSGKELKSTGGGLSTMPKGKKTTFQERLEIIAFVMARNKDYQAGIQKYGVSYQQIYSWVKKYESQGAEGLQDFRGKRREKEGLSEMEQLRLENKYLKERMKFLEMEQDIVKKLQAFQCKSNHFH
ncbi:helix-turn-helix domain-containing protein [Listeria booriae]|uniref:Transposase n=1 Tax=Listeria booriae TaxID=1552123 RepID=A0A842AF53_9LIST|nr:helix-turn-helix domain-containing protein [Listeria booriae]MBC1403231.1 transposase [Listeria booriae]MBC1616523.1 transposase [Listeria booriae]MBC2320434.1 transposase [Listeria booriae]